MKNLLDKLHKKYGITGEDSRPCRKCGSEHVIRFSRIKDDKYETICDDCLDHTIGYTKNRSQAVRFENKDE